MLTPIALGMKTKICKPVAIFPLLNFVRNFLSEPCGKKHPLQYFEKSIKRYQKVSNVKKRFASSKIAKCCPAVIAGLKREGVGAYPLKRTKLSILVIS
jgi:hypothetical protein